jgi:phospholipid transport system substrate-binding protein
VATTVKVKQDVVPVEYKLFRENEKGEWRIYDIVTDDVSLLETYQGQFRKLMADKGFDGLLTTLKSKRAQLEKNSGATPPAQ